MKFYNSCIFPHFIYCSTVWSGCDANHMGKLYKAQKQAARLILDVPYDTPSSDMFSVLKWLPIEKYFKFKRICMFYKCIHGLVPNYLSHNITLANDEHRRCTRFSVANNVIVPKHRTTFYSKQFFTSGAQDWNNLPNPLKDIQNFNSFRDKLVDYFWNS